MVRDCRPPAREPGELLVGAPLDDGDVDAGQRQLARQHQPRRAAAGDHHRMLGHRHASALMRRGFHRRIVVDGRAVVNR